MSTKCEIECEYNNNPGTEDKWTRCSSSSFEEDKCFIDENIQDGKYKVKFRLNCNGAKSEEAIFGVIVDKSLPDVIFTGKANPVVGEWIDFRVESKSGEDVSYKGWSVSQLSEEEKESVKIKALDRSDNTTYKSTKKTRFSVSTSGEYGVTVESLKNNKRTKKISVFKLDKGKGSRITLKHTQTS